MNLKSHLLQSIRRNRSRVMIRSAALAAEKFLRAYYNENHWQQDENGEGRVIAVFSKLLTRPEPVIFDVGAHEGSWAAQVRRQIPGARITCFEIIPPIRATIEARFKSDPAVQIVNAGLSDTNGTVAVAWNRSDSTTSSIAPRLTNQYYRAADVETLRCSVRRGDDIVTEMEIDRIDFLKIDVEGHEPCVLAGFKQTLADPAKAPRIIQFEYGDTYIPAGRTLYEVYQMLNPCGYRIGRVYPNEVGFRDYDFADEHYRMGNYVAVREGDPLLEALAR